MSEKRILAPRQADALHPAPRPYLIERSDRCINCGTCITACIYECHERESDDPRKMADPKPDCCRNCFACILRCPRNALIMKINPAYESMGDGEVYTPELILSLHEQAAAGKIPVSGAGYTGRFSGTGYDNMWTDMSEIVRPTRDGIHGREHISTTINLGRQITDLGGLQFDDQWRLKSHIPPNREIPIPILFEASPFPLHPDVNLALALAASQLQTFLALSPAEVCPGDENDTSASMMDFFNHLVLRLSPDKVEAHRESVTWASMVQIEHGEKQLAAVQQARRVNPQLVTMLRVPVMKGAEERVLDLARRGAEIIHLSADIYGRGDDGANLLDCLASVHHRLVESGWRDQITLLASGGIAAAEHVPKTIILGADAVFINVPLLVAMECTVCGRCLNGEACPRHVGEIDETWTDVRGPQAYYKWGATRVINLILSWRDQLLEVLGAMGIRDVRRLRGETGRAIFADRTGADFVKRLGQPTNVIDEKQTTHSVSTFANVDQITPMQSKAPRRFPVLPGDWLVIVDRDKCVDCGICVDSCRYGVHRRFAGKTALEEPLHGKCIGLRCQEQNDWCCVTVCPWEAISLQPSTLDDVLGDYRWTAGLLKETYRQARTGLPPDESLGELVGASGGGFDRLRIRAYDGETKVHADDVDLSIPLNRREDFVGDVTIPLPWYGGGMSYGSISLQVMEGRAMAASELGTFTSTGEGGYPDDLIPYRDHVITQIATGLFGVREETIQRARLIEFKYAQGAKPGLGGHLLGEKNTPDVARMREAVEGTGLFSPFPFHSVYSVEDHKKHLDWIRAIHPSVLISVKVSTPADVDMVAVGSFYAGANIVNLDGAYGGTGAAPDIAKKNIAMPIEYAIAQVHDFLEAEGIRDRITLISGGGIRTPDDVLKAIALGADGVAIGTAELVAIDCVRCGNCERNRGCPIGIATTDRELSGQMTAQWVSRRIVNMYTAWSAHLRRRLAALNIGAVRDLRGRRDTLAYLDREMDGTT